MLSVLFIAFSLAFVASSTADTQSQNPNVWNFQIARKVIAAFQFNGMGMSIWEDQGVENITVISRRQFYVTPITEFLPNSTQCVFNDLTGANVVTYSIQLWNDRLQLAAMDRLRQMQIDVAAEQVQPLPFYQVRVIWNNAQQKLQKATLSSTWENNLQQQSIRQFDILADDKSTCDKLATTLQTKPDLFTSSIALQYSLSAASTATRTLTVKTEHFLNSQLVATLKNMDAQNPERYLTSDDANRLNLEIMNNVVASQVVDGEYVPDADMITLKDIVSNSLQSANADSSNFTGKIWESVFWDPIYARPDTVCSYLNKVLRINQGNHTVTKSDSYSDKGDGGVDFGIGGLKFGAKGGGEKSGSSSFSELQEWLRQHNYEVDIKGEMFIPKSLTLKRLNLGVLDRQETIYTKSVQMHHVDAPGLLTVTVGSKSEVQSEDIKRLRENTDALTNRVNALEPKAGQLDSRVGQLEGRVGQLEPGLATATSQLNANIENVRASLSQALASKVSRCDVQTQRTGDCRYCGGVVTGVTCVP